MDFTKLEYNPLALEDNELIWEKYPDLGMNDVYSKPTEEDFENGLDFEALSLLVSFVILYVDANSPFYKETNFDRRVALCCNALKIKEGSIVYNEVIAHSDRFSNILYEYFKWINDLPFESWFSLKSTVHGLYKYLRTPIGIDDPDLEADRRAKIQERLIGLEGKLLEKEAKLFPTQRIRDQINRENVKDKLTGYAERYASYHPALKPQ